MRHLTCLQAICEAQREEMARDERVILLGEDIRSNLFGTAGGFLEQFGPERVRNVPMSEAAFVGAGVGAAMTGLRPIVDMLLSSFMYVAMDQFVSQVAKSRYMFGGQADLPVVYRAAMFYGNGEAAHHSDRPYPTFMTVPGLKIAAPSTPADAKGLIKTAVRDDDPVIVFEDGSLWPTKGPIAEEGEALPSGEVPDEGDFLVPLGVADVKRAGTDVTVVAIAGSVPHALSAAATLATEGVSVEVVDPRTLVPMDWDTILGSVTKSGRLVIADPAHRTCSAASEIAATVADEAFSSLQAPIKRVTTPDVNIPFSGALEGGLYPTAEKIIAAVRSLNAPGRVAEPMMQTEIRLPQWGMGMREGTIVRWLQQPGDVVAEGDPLVEIEADKVTDVVHAPTSGTLLETCFPTDATVAVRTVIAVMGPA